MKFLVYSEVNAETIASSLGQSEYSYYFVLKEFLPVLRQLGRYSWSKTLCRKLIAFTPKPVIAVKSAYSSLSRLRTRPRWV